MVMFMPYLCKNACSKKEGVGRTLEQRSRPYRKARHEQPDNWKLPFLSHGRCRTCQAWQRFTDGNRCRCCGSMLSRRPREWGKRTKYGVINGKS